MIDSLLPQSFFNHFIFLKFLINVLNAFVLNFELFQSVFYKKKAKSEQNTQSFDDQDF